MLLQCLPASVHALDLWPFDDGISYDITFVGVTKKKAEKYELDTIARQAIDEKNPPETVAALRSHTPLMADRVRKTMASYAYHDAQVFARVEQTETDGKKDDPIITMMITPGNRYHVKKSEIVWKDNPVTIDKAETFFLKDGTATASRKILDSAEALTRHIEETQCFLSLELDPELILDREDHKAIIHYHASHGSAANFGNTRFTGKSAVDEDILRRSLKWEKGGCFSQTKIDESQTALLKTRLVASALIKVADTPDANGEVPVTINITDRPHRTLTAGASYGTDEGPGVNLGWEHRNVAGKAHIAEVKTRLSKINTSVKGSYTIPYFYHDDQQFRLSGDITQKNTDSFDSSSISALAAIDRKLTDELLIGIGGGIRISRITENDLQSENYGLFYIPAYAEWDSRDDVTNSTEGIYARATIAPYTDFTGQGVSFIKSDIESSTYLTNNDWLWKPTLALRAAYGQINGASTASIPADLRFYAGGGGSVRGYDFQAIGPQRNGESLGGTVWSEINTELRVRFTDDIGAVAFVDAGTVYEGNTFDPSEPLYFSAGIGGRYYSPVGPIRFDVGVPLTDLPDTANDNSNYAIYVSVGQSF